MASNSAATMASTAAIASSTPVYNSTVMAPLAALSPTHHGVLIIITNTFGLIMVLVFLMIRVSVRMFISRSHDKDDYLQCAAVAFCIIYSALVFAMVSKGFGTALHLIPPSNLIPMQKISYVSDFFYLITLWCSKCSMSFVFMRLTPDKRQTQVAKGILVAATIWLMVSILVIALRCDLSHPWIFINTTCTNVVLRWQIISAFDIAIEVALFGMSVVLVKDLKMALRRKAYVVVAFGLRLPIIAAIIVRLHYLSDNTSDPTFFGVFFVIWSIVEVDFSICSGNIDCLKPFIEAFNTSYGGSVEINALERETKTSGTLSTLVSWASRATYRKGKDNKESGSGGSALNSTTKRGEEYNMSNIGTGTGDSVHKMVTKAVLGGETSMEEAWVGQEPTNIVTITHDDATSVGSYDSNRMIIQKKTGWNVESAEPRH